MAMAVTGAPLDQVAAVSTDVVYEIFGRELSMGKSMGLTGMVNLPLLPRLGDGPHPAILPTPSTR